MPMFSRKNQDEAPAPRECPHTNTHREYYDKDGKENAGYVEVCACGVAVRTV